jgi:hypothetical protein
LRPAELRLATTCGSEVFKYLTMSTMLSFHYSDLGLFVHLIWMLEQGIGLEAAHIGGKPSKPPATTCRLQVLTMNQLLFTRVLEVMETTFCVVLVTSGHTKTVNGRVIVRLYILDEWSGKILNAGLERSVTSPPIQLSIEQVSLLLEGNDYSPGRMRAES